jgi:hypothetical protein
MVCGMEAGREVVAEGKRTVDHDLDQDLCHCHTSLHTPNERNERNGRICAEKERKRKKGKRKRKIKESIDTRQKLGKM